MDGMGKAWGWDGKKRGGRGWPRAEVKKGRKGGRKIGEGGWGEFGKISSRFGISMKF